MSVYHANVSIYASNLKYSWLGQNMSFVFMVKMEYNLTFFYTSAATVQNILFFDALL